MAGGKWYFARGAVPGTAAIAVRGRQLRYARVFAHAQEGRASSYENSIGLVEIAAPRASAAKMPGLEIGDSMDVMDTA